MQRLSARQCNANQGSSYRQRVLNRCTGHQDRAKAASKLLKYNRCLSCFSVNCENVPNYWKTLTLRLKLENSTDLENEVDEINQIEKLTEHISVSFDTQPWLHFHSLDQKPSAHRSIILWREKQDTRLNEQTSNRLPFKPQGTYFSQCWCFQGWTPP